MPQLKYFACDPSTHSQKELSLESLCKPIHIFFDMIEATACCSAGDFTKASVDLIASQADFAAFQLKDSDETL